MNDRVFAAVGLSEADQIQLFELLRKLRHRVGDFA
jgi:hypothetical protein